MDTVKCQLDIEQVYTLILTGNNLLRKELRDEFEARLTELEEKIDSKELKIDKKFDMLNSRIDLIETTNRATNILGKDPDQVSRIKLENITNQMESLSVRMDIIEKTQENSMKGEMMQSQNTGANLNMENIKKQLTSVRYAFQNEKEHVRQLKSIIRNQNDSLVEVSENQKATNARIETNEQEIKRLCETTVTKHEFNEEKVQFRNVENWISNKTNSLIQSHIDVTVRLQGNEEKIDRTIENTNAVQVIYDRKLEDIYQMQNTMRTKVEEITTKQNDFDQIIRDTARDFKVTTNNLETEMDQLEYRQNSLDQTTQSNLQSLNRLMTRINKRQVAFFAVRYTSNTRKLSVGSKIVFDYVIFQEGNGYNPHTGVFTCPESGVYMFSVVLTHGNTDKVGSYIRSRAVLKVGTSTKANIVTEQHHTYQTDQSSNLAIVKLYKGDKVWVQVFAENNMIARKYDSNFAGALLYN